jgi:hypothetical protein
MVLVVVIVTHRAREVKVTSSHMPYESRYCAFCLGRFIELCRLYKL